MATDDDTIEALRHYVRHQEGCAHAHMLNSTGGYWSSVGGGLPPARIIFPCTCGLDDVLRGIEAEKAGRNIGRNTNGN